MDETLVRLTVVRGDCRCGYCKTGDVFEVGDICPPLCCELWDRAYPYVFVLRNGGTLDYNSSGKAKAFDVACPDGGRVVLHGEAIEK